MKIAFVLSGMLLLACGSSSPAAIDAAITSDAHLNTLAATGTVTDRTTGMPIANAQVCTTGLPQMQMQCVTAGSDGTYSFTLALPDGTWQLAQITTAASYLGRENLLYEQPSSADGHSIFWENIGGLYSASDATTYFATQAGFTYPSSATGFIDLTVFGASATDMPAATVTISPSGGTAVYTNAMGIPDRTLTDTSQGHDVLFGNLAPGTYAITVQATGRTCSALENGGTINGEWPPAGSETLSVAVSANALTNFVTVNCI